MQRTISRSVRSRGIFSMFGKGSADATEPTKLTKDQQDKLRTAIPGLRTDAPRSAVGSSSTFDSNDIIDHRIDEDSIRARGVMRYRYNYTPPSSVESVVISHAKAILVANEKSVQDVLGFNFANDNSIKAKIIISIASELKHSPTNSRLLHLKTIGDVLDFFLEPVQNIDQYTKLARASNRPTNVHVMEQAVRFHPEDKEAWHGGVTAFPGTGGRVFGLRNQRLLRQFQPKDDWFDYEDTAFDYTRPDKDMPWDSEIAKRMDRYPDKRYNLSTKTFTRAK